MLAGAASGGEFCTPMRTTPQKNTERERERGISIPVGERGGLGLN